MKKEVRGINLKNVITFFAAMTGGGKEIKDVLGALSDMALIDKKDMGEILKKASSGLEKVASEIKDAPTKHWIYREAMVAAYLDRKITALERKSLNKIKRILGISDKKAKDIENWVKKFLPLAQKGNEIIFGK